MAKMATRERAPFSRLSGGARASLAERFLLGKLAEFVSLMEEEARRDRSSPEPRTSRYAQIFGLAPGSFEDLSDDKTLALWEVITAGAEAFLTYCPTAKPEIPAVKGSSRSTIEHSTSIPGRLGISSRPSTNPPGRSGAVLRSG